MNALKTMLAGVWVFTLLIFSGCEKAASPGPVEPLLITAQFDSLHAGADEADWIGVQDRTLDFFHRVLRLEEVERKQAELDPVSVDLKNGTGELVILTGTDSVASNNKTIARVTLSGLPENRSTVEVKVGMVLSQKKFLYLFVLDADTGEPLKITI